MSNAKQGTITAGGTPSQATQFLFTRLSFANKSAALFAERHTARTDKSSKFLRIALISQAVHMLIYPAPPLVTSQ
jgi:hypothetical protein